MKNSFRDLLKQWDIGPIGSIEPISSFTGKASLVRTRGGRRYILKEKPDQAGAEREAVLLTRLEEAGAPVAVPLHTRAGAPYALLGEKPFCLSLELPGKVFTRHYAGRAVRRAGMFGRAIAFLHACLLKCEPLPGYPDFHLMEHIREWAFPIIRRHPAGVDVGALESAWMSVEEEMGPIYNFLPVQLIHRDAHPGNMLFQGDRLTGFIDFDMVVRGPRIFDLAYCGTSLLMAAYPDKAKVQLWTGLMAGLRAGYREIAPLTPSEAQAFKGIMIAIELIYVALGLHIRSENVSKSNEELIHWLAKDHALIYP